MTTTSPNQSTATVTCIGEVLWDSLEEGLFLGGAPFNVACHLHRLGVPVSMISAVGKDLLGEETRLRVSRLGLDPSGILEHPKLPTSMVKVTLNKERNATYDIVEPVAWDDLEGAGADDIHLPRGAWLVLGSLAFRSEANRRLLARIRGESRPRMLVDVNLRPPYHHIERLAPLWRGAYLLKMNEVELFQLSEEMESDATIEDRCREVAARFSAEWVCVTRGAAGAALFGRKAWLEEDAPETKVIDTIGAGDAFMAFMVRSFVQNETDLSMALRGACKLGAEVAAQRGALLNS